jgi:hypothetical protein
MVEKIDVALILFATFSLGSSFVSLAYDITRPPPKHTLIGDSTAEQNHLEVSMLLERIEGEVRGDRLEIRLTLRNVGGDDYMREMRMPLFDLLLCSESGAPVAKWSDDRNLTKALLRIHIAPGERFIETKIWDFKERADINCNVPELNPGKYQLSGVWMGGPIIMTTPVKLEIKP